MKQIMIPAYLELIINEYYENNAEKLNRMIDKILLRFGGLSGKDKDDFYSLANEVIIDVIRRYDKSQSFEAFLYTYLLNKIKSEMTKRNREKRKADRMSVSIDTPVGEDEKFTIGETIKSDFDIDVELSERIEDFYSENVIEYLDSLSEIPKKIAKLIMKGYESFDIKNILNITDKQYKDYWNVICSYDKKRILYKEISNMEDNEMKTMTMEENVTEKYKNTSYSIESISKQLKKKKIRDDHILQRHSGQWKGFAKSELVSDILRGKSLTQIIISEEIKNGIRMQWLIDGKQRCTTLDDFLHDGFAISKNVKNYNIAYQISKLDEDGNEVLNEEGFPITEWKAFDIRGKKFSQLPEELQDVFKDRQIPVLYNMNCTKKDIADDIARFNRSRPMNKAQNGWLELDESFAELVGNIAKMPFFQTSFVGSTYTNNNETSGAIRRIIIESIMVSDFIEDFDDFNKMCEFLSEEASDSNFTEFYSLVERLTVICNTKEIATLFNAKDSFIWFGLFSRFTEFGLNDFKFADFMNEFEALRRIKIENKSFDDILAESKSTKDKGIVMKKLNHLEKLMKEYFNIQEVQNNDIVSNNETEVDSENFIADLLDMDIKIVKEEMDTYNDTLDDLISKTIKDGSKGLKLFEPENRNSLLAMVAYSYKDDVDLDEWMAQFAKENNTYLNNQKENYLFMLTDFKNYTNKNRKSA